jgi:putative ABC transport system permease protein
MEFRPILSALMRNKTGPILVALQVALSLAILANALSIVQDRRAVVARPTGMADEHAVFYVGVNKLRGEAPEQQLATMKRQIEVLRAVPGVVAAADVSQAPLSRSGILATIRLTRQQQYDNASVSLYLSSGSLIAPFGLKLIAGRDFRPDEFITYNDIGSAGLPPQIIVTKALADKLWPGVPPLGKQILFGDGEQVAATQVIGVVERLQTAHAPNGPEIEYSVLLPSRLLYAPRVGTLFVVRAEPGQRDRVMKEAEAALRKSSPIPLILEWRTADQDRAERYRADVALQWMLAAVSVLLLLVTCSGIVGMASLWVTQRRKQIGVRRALGARRIDVLRYFIVENLMITSAGVAGGVLLGLGLNALLVSRLEMARLPAGYLVAGAVLLWLLGVLAAWGPAWRAASISPATATRSI